jgi:hypothetical protein
LYFASFRDFVGRHGNNRYIVEELIDTEQVTPVCRFAPATGASRRTAHAKTARIGYDLLIILSVNAMFLEMGDYVVRPKEFVVRHRRLAQACEKAGDRIRTGDVQLGKLAFYR